MTTEPINSNKTAAQLEVEAFETRRAANEAVRVDQLRRAGYFGPPSGPTPAPAAAPAVRPAAPPRSALEQLRAERLVLQVELAAQTPEQRLALVDREIADLEARERVQRRAVDRLDDMWHENLALAQRLDLEGAWSRFATFSADLMNALQDSSRLRTEIDRALKGTVSAAIRRTRGTRRDGATPLLEADKPWAPLVRLARGEDGDPSVLQADVDILGIAVR